MGLHSPFLLLSIDIAIASSHNITDILTSKPDYNEYNTFLTQTKLVDEINCQTITVLVLVLNNVALSSKHPLSVVKEVMSLVIL